MPIYEFFCSHCNTVFNFYSRTVNTATIPLCPKCRTQELKRMLSKFAPLSGKGGEKEPDDLPMDETKMERALQVLEKEISQIRDDDPRQAVSLLRKMTEAAGGNLNEGMEEALRRMEAGEDPEAVEADLGEQMAPENIFSDKKIRSRRTPIITYDETLYEL